MSVRWSPIGQVLELAGPLPVRHLKIDAQGMDLKLVKSLERMRLLHHTRAMCVVPLLTCAPEHPLSLSVAGTHPSTLFRRVSSVQMESRTSQCTPLYEGQETCEEVRVPSLPS